MDFEAGMYMAEEGMAEVIGALLSGLTTNVMSFGVSIVAYVFTALGLYTIAQRRGIKNPWMAWVPVLNVWILGSIADQYRYVAKGEVRSRRKVLMTTAILQTVAWLAVMVLLVVMMVKVVMQIPNFGMMSDQMLLSMVLELLLPMAGGLLAMGVIAIVHAVFSYIAYADLFASCEPDNKVLYLVLGIFISITLPIFVFICRKKDLGMPPRRAQQTAPVQPPVTEIPAADAIREPWENPEE